MKRNWRDVCRAAAWLGAVYVGLLPPLRLFAESACPTRPPGPAPQKPLRTVLGPETPSPDDFELFLEGVLEAPRGPHTTASGAYVPAYRACPGCCDSGGPDKKATAPIAEVHWRTDYGKARDEAKDKGRPLVLLFRTTFCPWCDKLDTAIREDAEASKLLNESVVPVELSGVDNPMLAAALQIDVYPTVVVAAADGKILRRLVGYHDAATLKKEIQEGLEKPATAS